MTQGDEQEAEKPRDVAERAVFELVPRFLETVELEPWDHSGGQGAVDARLHYPDGRIAALEVTTEAGEGVRQLYALLGDKYQTQPNPGEWTWSATVDHPRDLPELAARLPRLIPQCESSGIRDPKHAYSLMQEPDIRWLMASSATLHGSPDLPKMDGDRERPLYVMPGGRGCVINETLERFATAMDEALDTANIKRHADKLARSGYDERHLCVLVDDSALSSDVHMARMSRGVMPPVPPRVPASVTHLWVMVTFTPWVFLITSEVMQRFDRSSQGESQ